jgi:hypothetical protein
MATKSAKPTKISKAKRGHGNTRKHTECELGRISCLPCVSVAETGFSASFPCVGFVDFVAIEHKATS